MADLLEQNGSPSSFMAVDAHVGAGGGVTTLRIAEEQVASTMSAEMYMDAVIAMFPDPVEIIARDSVTLPGGKAGHLRTRVQANNRVAEQVGYFIKCGDTVYSLAYTTSRAEVSERLSSFDKSAGTFMATP